MLRLPTLYSLMIFGYLSINQLCALKLVDTLRGFFNSPIHPFFQAENETNNSRLYNNFSLNSLNKYCLRKSKAESRTDLVSKQGQEL